MVTKGVVRVELFNYVIRINIFDEWDEVKQYYSNDKKDEREGFVLLSDTNCILFINSDCFSNMIHEIVHIKNIIFQSMGHIIDYDNDEVEAYLSQYLYKKIFNIFDKHIKKKRTKS